MKKRPPKPPLVLKPIRFENIWPDLSDEALEREDRRQAFEDAQEQLLTRRVKRRRLK